MKKGNTALTTRLGPGVLLRYAVTIVASVSITSAVAIPMAVQAQRANIVRVQTDEPSTVPDGASTEPTSELAIDAASTGSGTGGPYRSTEEPSAATVAVDVPAGSADVVPDLSSSEVDEDGRSDQLALAPVPDPTDPDATAPTTPATSPATVNSAKAQHPAPATVTSATITPVAPTQPPAAASSSSSSSSAVAGSSSTRAASATEQTIVDAGASDPKVTVAAGDDDLLLAAPPVTLTECNRRAAAAQHPPFSRLADCVQFLDELLRDAQVVSIDDFVAPNSETMPTVGDGKAVEQQLAPSGN